MILLFFNLLEPLPNGTVGFKSKTIGDLLLRVYVCFSLFFCTSTIKRATLSREIPIQNRSVSCFCYFLVSSVTVVGSPDIKQSVFELS